MARIMIVTETEMQSLLDILELKKWQSEANGHLYLESNPTTIGEVHRMFLYHVVGWTQEMGYKGYRG